jgi:hypothetical protein
MKTLTGFFNQKWRQLWVHRVKGRAALREAGRRMREESLGAGVAEASGDPSIKHSPGLKERLKSPSTSKATH